MTAAGSFHCLNLAGTTFYVDDEVRKEVEAFLRTSPSLTESIIVESLVGEEVTVIADAVNAIWSSTPETRAWYREFDRMFKDEVPIEERTR